MSSFHSIRTGLLYLFRLLLLWPSVVVRDFDSDLPGVFAFAIQVMPQVILSPAWDDDLAQIDPSLSNYLGFLIIVKHRHLQLVVIRRVVYCES